MKMECGLDIHHVHAVKKNNLPYNNNNNQTAGEIIIFLMFAECSKIII